MMSSGETATWIFGVAGTGLPIALWLRLLAALQPIRVVKRPQLARTAIRWKSKDEDNFARGLAQPADTRCKTADLD